MEKNQTGFSLSIMATNWGIETTMDAFCEKASIDGYDGVEVWWPETHKAQQELFAALTKYDLEAGFICGSNEIYWKDNLESFRKSLEAATRLSNPKPLYINCHSGKDHYTTTRNQDFIDLTTKISSETGIKIYHETHRGRILYSAPVTRKFIEKNPSLKLTLDISHWCNVHESFLEDQPENVQLALLRTEHIHARIGHPEGPQVSDPRAPEWETALQAHLNWWDIIIKRKKQEGESMTILTEFGPPDYMWTLPYSRKPVSDQWSINLFMQKLLRERYT